MAASPPLDGENLGRLSSISTHARRNKGRESYQTQVVWQWQIFSNRDYPDDKQILAEILAKGL
jgi:hypothetical protein